MFTREMIYSKFEINRCRYPTEVYNFSGSHTRELLLKHLRSCNIIYFTLTMLLKYIQKPRFLINLLHMNEESSSPFKVASLNCVLPLDNNGLTRLCVWISGGKPEGGGCWRDPKCRKRNRHTCDSEKIYF